MRSARLFQRSAAAQEPPVGDDTAGPVSPMKPGKAQVRIVNVILERTLNDGDEPLFGIIDKQLDRQGSGFARVRLRAVLRLCLADGAGHARRDGHWQRVGVAERHSSGLNGAVATALVRPGL